MIQRLWENFVKLWHLGVVQVQSHLIKSVEVRLQECCNINELTNVEDDDNTLLSNKSHSFGLTTRTIEADFVAPRMKIFQFCSQFLKQQKRDDLLGLVSLKPFLKQLDVSLPLLETETCNLSWRNSGRVAGHRTLQTRLLHVKWFIQPTAATCLMFFTILMKLTFPKDTFVCRVQRLPSELKNLKLSYSKIF